MMNSGNSEGGNALGGFVPPNLFEYGSGSNNGMSQSPNPMMPNNNMPKNE